MAYTAKTIAVANFQLKNFDYVLPKQLIATRPCSPRDYCRLLVYDRQTKKIIHTRFNKILRFLKTDDVLVLNNTKVFPARLVSKKYKILLLKKISHNKWQVLIDGKKRQVGMQINFGSNLVGKVASWKGQGIWEIKFNQSGKKFWKLVLELGKMPIPPYIKQKQNLNAQNKKWYQTIYAKYFGSVAAPTAGLHFTKRLLQKLKQQGIQIEYITLHVGLGTFAPVRSEDIRQHKMHPEYFTIKKETLKRLKQAKKEKRRIIAVGTTVVRAMETKKSRGWVNLFIYPPYKFKFVNALITNFHLPKSTLLMMIEAFLQNKCRREYLPAMLRIALRAGVFAPTFKKIYQAAIKRRYRFYSYGDAMLIL